MRIRIDDDFDSELESEYRSVDNDSVIGNGALSNSNTEIIEVKDVDIKEEKYNKEKNSMDDNKVEVNSYNLNNGFSVEIQGATFIDIEEDSNYTNASKDTLEEKNKIKEKPENNNRREIEEKIKPREKIGKSYSNIKGKITVYSKIGDVKGDCISEAKINLYALNGLSPKLVSSKLTDENGIVIFDNLAEGSYRVIEIVNRKYFEKPTYIQWNEVTINKDLKEEKVIVVNRIKKYSR